MADSQPTTIAIPLNLPRPEAMALAQFVKRTTYEDCVNRSSLTARYGDRDEHDVVWEANDPCHRRLAGMADVPSRLSRGARTAAAGAGA